MMPDPVTLPTVRVSGEDYERWVRRDAKEAEHRLWAAEHGRKIMEDPKIKADLDEIHTAMKAIEDGTLDREEWIRQQRERDDRASLSLYSRGLRERMVLCDRLREAYELLEPHRAEPGVADFLAVEIPE